MYGPRSSLDRSLFSDAISSLDLPNPPVWSASSPYIGWLENIPLLDIFEHPLFFHHIGTGYCSGTGDRVSGIRPTLSQWWSELAEKVDSSWITMMPGFNFSVISVLLTIPLKGNPLASPYNRW